VIGLSNKLLLCFCLCFGFTEAAAQYRINQWTADDGLPQNSIYRIVQTNDGYLWLATLDGLARFDGARFTVFNKSNSPGIVNNRFQRLFEDAGGNLWAGTEESGIVRFSGGRFEHFGAETDISLNLLYGIESDVTGDGAIFHGTNGTFRFRDGKFSPVDERSYFSPAPTARSSSVKIVCRQKVENNLSECYVNGGWLSFSFSDVASQRTVEVIPTR
jgi:hypothetical protein